MAGLRSRQPQPLERYVDCCVSSCHCYLHTYFHLQYPSDPNDNLLATLITLTPTSPSVYLQCPLAHDPPRIFVLPHWPVAADPARPNGRRRWHSLKPAETRHSFNLLHSRSWNGPPFCFQSYFFLVKFDRHFCHSGERVDSKVQWWTQKPRPMVWMVAALSEG